VEKSVDVKPVSQSVCIFVFMVYLAQAQQMLGPTYDISIPTGETRSFIAGTSMLGFGLESRKMTNDHMSIGINFHWNTFQETARVSREGDEESTFVIEERTMDLYPLLLSGHYYFGDPVDRFRVFIGTNAGVYFNVSRYTRDSYRYVNKTWHFGFAPETGFLLDFIHDIRLLVTVRYNYGFATSSSEARSWVNILIGFVTVSLF
jgi:hypothetical protein